MRKIGKILMGSLTLPAVAVPMTTLASCGQTWGHATPMYIGSITNGPYAQLESDHYFDRDGVDIVSYLQDNYSIQKSSNANYGYSTPYKFNDDKNVEQIEPEGWEPANVGWYTSADSAFVTSAKDEWKEDGETKSAVRYSARNAALSQNIDFVSSIGSTISSYIDLALNYTATQVRTNFDESEEDIKTTWGGSLDHGKKGGTTAEQKQNNEFYEFLFALANNVDTETGKNIAMLKTSNVNFTFNTMPLPSYKFEGEGPSRARVDLSDSFKTMLEKNADWTTPSTTLRYFSKKSDVREETNPDEKDNPFKYISYTYEDVPILVHASEYKKTFVNVSKNADSYLLNDYYSSDSEVTNTIGSQWKSGKRRPGIQAFTDIADADAKPNFKEYSLTPSEQTITASCPEERMPAEITGNDFVILVSYTVNLYNQDEGIDEGHPERNVAIINGLSYMFPAYFIQLYQGDDSLYKDLKEGGPKVFDKKKIEKHNLDLLNLWNRSSKEGKKPHARDLNEDSKNLLQFISWMFGTNSSFLIPGQQIPKQ